MAEPASRNPQIITSAGTGRTALTPGHAPAETLDAYFSVMQPAMLILTCRSTRRMMRDWMMTPAQTDNVVKAGRGRGRGTTRVAPDGAYAVILYSPHARGCARNFFTRTNDGWLLDLVTLQRVIRFGRSNAWRLAERSGHPYAFAFEDWRFDANGFPRWGQ